MNELHEIERRNPGWRAWLAAVREVLSELDNPMWDGAVPTLSGERRSAAPLLSSAEDFPAQPLDSLRRRLANSEIGEAAISALLPMPVLHACRRRWSAELPGDWAQGYCPLCGAWPAFAETCGVERRRTLRCCACGAMWSAHPLWCPYCSAADHHSLASLVVDQRPAVIEVCERCRGYLKAFQRLQPAPATQVLLEDLASVDLDIAARQRGYRRPDGLGFAIG